MTGSRLRVAIVGCGAVSELFHLPALIRSSTAVTTALVDRDEGRMARLSDLLVRAGAPEPARCRSIDGLDGLADAALVATPHTTHAPITEALLASGMSALVEKPLATTTEECRRLAAAASGRVVGVGLVRRLYPTVGWLDRNLGTGAIGPVRSLHVEEGAPYDWPATTTSFFDPAASGGGVLIDTGSHVLDLVRRWAGPDLEVVAAAHDSQGGVEAEVEVELAAGAVKVQVVLSRVRLLDNAIVVEGDRGRARIPTQSEGEAVLEVDGHRVTEDVRPGLGEPPTFEALFDEQLRLFLAAVTGEGEPLARLEDGSAVAALIEEAYAAARPLSRPWATS